MAACPPSATSWASGRWLPASSLRTEIAARLVAGVTIALILRWNGTAWKQLLVPPSAAPGHLAEVGGVAATSARSAWVVVTIGAGPEVLELHWNGGA